MFTKVCIYIYIGICVKYTHSHTHTHYAELCECVCVCGGSSGNGRTSLWVTWHHLFMVSFVGWERGSCVSGPYFVCARSEVGYVYGVDGHHLDGGIVCIYRLF